MSRLRAAGGGELQPSEQGLKVFKVAGGVFIEKLKDCELICSTEANGYRLPSGTNLGKVKKTHPVLRFFSL